MQTKQWTRFYIKFFACFLALNWNELRCLNIVYQHQAYPYFFDDVDLNNFIMLYGLENRFNINGIRFPSEFYHMSHQIPQYIPTRVSQIKEWLL